MILQLVFTQNLLILLLTYYDWQLYLFVLSRFINTPGVGKLGPADEMLNFNPQSHNLWPKSSFSAISIQIRNNIQFFVYSPLTKVEIPIVFQKQQK